MKLSPSDYQAIKARAEVLVTAEEVEATFSRMAEAITADMAGLDPVVLCVMTGGVVVSGRLLPKLDFPLRLDYAHATRYRGETSGADLHWKHHPAEAVRGEHVLVLDDIFDEGLTMDAIVRACEADGAQSVRSAVLVRKERTHACEYRPDYVGMVLPDRYLIGIGLDYRTYFRNYDGILAVADEDV